MSTPVITGTIFEDANGLQGTPANTIDGTPTNVGNQLFVNLVDPEGNVVLCNPVEADGNYKFQDVQPAGYPTTYSIVLSNTYGVTGDAAPAPALPSGWVNTGEFLGTGAGNDGTVNGILPDVTLTNAATVRSNALFGIEQLPNTAPKLKTYPLNTPGVIYTVPGFTGTDPEQGALGAGNTFMINTLPLGATLFYNGIAVTSPQIINNFVPAQLMIDPLDATLTTSFTYSAIDGAGEVDQSPATITLNWSTVLAVNLLDFEVSKNQQTAILQWTTSEQVNASYVEIERSSNSTDFVTIKKLDASINSFVTNSYSFTDLSPLPGTNFYRLMFVNTNGSIQYSETKLVTFTSAGTVLTFPNPVQSQLHITLSGHWLNTPVQLDLYNQLGQKIYSKQVTQPQPTESLDVHQLPSAVYILKLTAPDNSASYINIRVK